MAFALSTFATQLLNTVPETDTEFTAIIRNQIIKQAVLEYGRDKPEIVVDDVTGDGGKYYNLTGGSTVMSAWVERFSQIRSIQYPAPTIASDEHPVYLDGGDYDQDYRDASVTYLWFPNHAPSATETIRIAYTGLYVWAADTATTTVAQTSHGFSLNDYIYQDDDDNETWVAAGSGAGDLLATHQATTITDGDNFTATELGVSTPQVDFYAIIYKAACIACQSISEKYSRSSDGLISADSVAHLSKASEFSQRAEEFCKLYSEHIAATGGDSTTDDRVQGHAEFVDLDIWPMFPSNSRRFLHHSRDGR